MQQNFLDRVKGSDEGKKSLDPAHVLLLSRLKIGQERLTREWKRVRYLETSKRADRVITDAMDRFEALEVIVRTLFDHKGCVIGKRGCDEDSPVRCQYCGETAGKEAQGG